MHIKIVAKDIDLLSRQSEEIEAKFKELERISRRYGTRHLLTITIGRNMARQETGEVFFAEANFAIPGKDIICRAQGESIEAVADQLKDKLKNLMVKNKEYRESRLKKLARAVKKKLCRNF